MEILFYSGLMLLFLTISVGILLVRGYRQIGSLKDVPVDLDRIYPKVSVIIPALNEEETIVPALESVLALEYPDLEIIVINDRSTDRTGEILDSMVRDHPTLTVFHKQDLEPGWLGKNHALQSGAENATGEYLLFTDADVVMDRSCLLRAMHFMTENKLDHLSVIFDPVPQSALLNSVIMQLMVALLFILRPWTASDRHSGGFIGVGAFNLVKKTAYKEIGMHEQFSMHPADDLMLGKLIKKNGFSQSGLISGGNVSVLWYRTVSEIIRGTEKNLFSVVNFNLFAGLSLIAIVILLTISPLWVVIFFPLKIAAPFLMVILLRILLTGYLSRRGVLNPMHALLIPITDYIILFMIVNSIFKTLRNNGITWRGTFYPIKELRSGCNMKLYG